MRATAGAPLRSGSRSGSSGTSGAKAVKKLRKGEGKSAGKSKSSDNAAACNSAAPQQDGSCKSTSFCTPSLPCWAAAERDALEQLTDEFFSRHRLHLRVWPVSAGSGATAGESATAAGAARTAGPGGGGSSSKNATAGPEATSRRGRAATAAAGRDEQSRKDGRRESGAVDRKGLAEVGGALRRSGSVCAPGGPAAAALERSASRRTPIPKSRGAASAATAVDTGVLQRADTLKEVKREEPVPEEEDEATKVRREQLLNVRAMLYDRVTENVSFTCTEYNTPSKPSRNAKLPGFLRLRGVRASGSCPDLGLCENTAAAQDAAGTGRGGGATGGVDNLAVMRQGLKKDDGTPGRGELKHEGSSGSESAVGRAAAAGKLRKREGGAEHQERDGSSSGRWSQQNTPTAAAAAGRKNTRSALQKEETASTGSRGSVDGDAYHVSSKQTWNHAHQDIPEDIDACGDPGKLKELQQSLLSDGFTGCWVLLLTEKYVPPTSPTALSPQHASSTHRVNQASAASFFPPQTQKQRRLSAGEQNTEGPAPAERAGGEGVTAAAAQGETGADAAARERDEGVATGVTTQQEVLHQQPRQQPRVRRIIVCGALIEVYSNNERQIAALWCLPCLSAHATRLLLQAFLPRVLLEALRIPDVVATPEEEGQQQETVNALQAPDSSSSKKRKLRQEEGQRDATSRGEHKQQQQRQQRGSHAGGNYHKKTAGEDVHTKQQNGYYLERGEKGRRRKSCGSAVETESGNVSAVRRGDGKGGTQLCVAVKQEAGQSHHILRPIKSVFAVYEDILLWPRQALFLIASSSRLGFMRHAEPLLGVPADDEEEENVVVTTRKNMSTDEKQRRNLAYRKQPYLHVDAGLGPQWRECNCRRRFFSSRPQLLAQQRKRRGTPASGKGSGPGAAGGGGKGGSREEANSSSSRKGGSAAAATAATWGGQAGAAASRRDSGGSGEAPPSSDGLLRFFSVSDLWAARLMPPREKRAALQHVEVTAAQLPHLAATAQTKQEGGREGEEGCSSSSTATLVAGSSTGDKASETDETPTQVKAVGKNWSSRGETTKQEDKKGEASTTAAAKLPSGSVRNEGGQDAVWSAVQQCEKRMKGENADASNSKFWPEATDGWSCLVPRGTSEQILREIYCDLPVLSETNFEECLAEEVDVRQDEMCGLSESECKELLRWWDK